MAKESHIKIGTSGWMYEHWRETFYPENIAQEEMLSFYADSFDTVEINNTFYNLPEAESVEEWKRKTPDDFVFAIKANRYITHMKNLKEAEEPLNRLLDRITELNQKLGIILFQLPPGWHFNFERLQSFLSFLPEQYRYTFEFRHKSWYDEKVFGILQKNNIALCIHDHADASSPERLTADFTYVRFHGPDGTYQQKYTSDQMSEWAETISSWQSQDIDVYCYFNNDAYGNAVENSLELKDMLNNQ